MNKLKSGLIFLGKALLIILLLGSLTGVALALNLFGEATLNLPSCDRQVLQALPTNSVIYDYAGKPVAKLLGKMNLVPVKLGQINQVMQDAVVSIEDERFYDHRGIDYWGLARAVFNDLRGGSQEGASTITQQLVKNVLLSPEKSLLRKIREAALARKVEAAFNKREILEFYLNSIYFGEGAYGIEAASQTYFAKPCQDLTLAESALLAGLPKSPSRYSPFTNPTEAKKRRDTVLQVMYRNSYISQAQLQSASSSPLPVKHQLRKDEYPYPYFLDQTIDELIRHYGFSQDQVYDGGLQIYTTLDPNIQTTLEQVYADPANFPGGEVDRGPESAMVILEQKTGGIKGLVGGRTHVSRRGYNRATMLRRQPGSTLKPLVVYSPAIEKGYGPATLLDSSVESYGTDNYAYTPENFANSSWGKISMRTAVNNSVNTYAVKLLKLVGVESAYEFGKRLGLSSLNSQDKALGLALGGITQGLSPLELASAYSALANRGVKLETHIINKVVDPSGKVLLEIKPNSAQVMKPETADMITDLLKSAVEQGTGKLARIEGHQAAGKTGTTELPNLAEFAGLKQGNKDAWFAGYTPELVGVVWIGYDITDRLHYLNKVSGGSYPAAIWNKVFSQILSGFPPSSFAPAPTDMLLAEKRLHWVSNKPKKVPATLPAKASADPESGSAETGQNEDPDRLQSQTQQSPDPPKQKNSLAQKFLSLFKN